MVHWAEWAIPQYLLTISPVFTYLHHISVSYHFTQKLVNPTFLRLSELFFWLERAFFPVPKIFPVRTFFFRKAQERKVKFVLFTGYWTTFPLHKNLTGSWQLFRVQVKLSGVGREMEIFIVKIYSCFGRKNTWKYTCTYIHDILGIMPFKVSIIKN